MNKSHLVGQLLNSIHDARTHVYIKKYQFVSSMINEGNKLEQNEIFHTTD